MTGWASLLQKGRPDTTTIQRMAAHVSFRIFTLYYQVWSYLHSTFGGSPAVTKLQACQYCLAAAHAEQVVISKPLEVLQLLTR